MDLHYCFSFHSETVGRLWNPTQGQERICETRCGIQVILPTRWSCCGKIQEMWAGKTRHLIVGSCSTDHMMGTSGTSHKQSEVLHLQRVNSLAILQLQLKLDWLNKNVSNIYLSHIKGSFLWRPEDGCRHRNYYWYDYERRQTWSILLLTREHHLGQPTLPMQW